MILLLDTSTPICKLTLLDGDKRYDTQWEANRELAKHLLSYLHGQLQSHGKTWQDIESIAVFKGPGSFTGLRIGLSVLNTIADSEQLPIVGETGDDWQEKALARFKKGENDRIVLPFYGSEAHITKPRK